MTDQPPQLPPLPRRMIGANLPAEAHHHATTAGRARIPDPADVHWSHDERAIRLLLNGLRRWATH